MRLIVSASVLAFVLFLNSIELSSSQADNNFPDKQGPPLNNVPLFPGRHRLVPRQPGHGHPHGHRHAQRHPRRQFGPTSELELDEGRVATQEEYARRRGHPIVNNPNQLENPGIRRQLVFEAPASPPRPHSPGHDQASITNIPESEPKQNFRK